MSSKSNISLCSDTLGHLLWECWWLKLVHQAPCHYWILHETPWPTCRSRISNIPLQRRPWPSHLTSFSHASSIQCIILTNLTFKLKWYQEHESYIPSLSSLNFSQHYLLHSAMLYVQLFYGSIMFLSILNLLTWSPTVTLAWYFMGTIIHNSFISHR